MDGPVLRCLDNRIARILNHYKWLRMLPGGEKVRLPVCSATEEKGTVPMYFDLERFEDAMDNYTDERALDAYKQSTFHNHQ